MLEIKTEQLRILTILVHLKTDAIILHAVKDTIRAYFY